ncbi:uncharacterized protein FOMMEDRAFT_20521 [Fomitiporia mediterranea MF3/22]|uniref:uncharacterized protein n=1 Tax=Fomitiporia mediterranea (strain MF3/22) TaxID=694068 RepID=UPI0004408276|nr:uncharacterized protein FOMMEDRAFT_20521 [Fomitiporia mediterranea MF3/22]EJD03424.1 hypothetical protein FOMMEDRAFT_20521 [Fomitiporia mediterranea MF3/22]
MSETFLLNCFGVAVLTVLVYHALTTMDKEVKYFWSNPCSSTSLIYFSNRYIGVVGSTSTMLYYRDNQDSLRCRATLWASQICSLSAILFVDCPITILMIIAAYTVTICRYSSNSSISSLLSEQEALSLPQGLICHRGGTWT